MICGCRVSPKALRTPTCPSLVELEIDALQGYYFSEPLPFEQFATLLQNHCASQNTLPRIAGQG